ncbi:MAG: pseudouridine-5'-phosphate glycosidase [Chloroflexi bacterium]|nr:pseudouridine-5'-phosphate glycosidase [Chloroflexota bacterium]
MNKLQINATVQSALREGRPVVALESTVIAHGLPYPQNLEAALAIEERVRAEGAVPATIAVLGGALRVGLDRRDLEHLATANNVRKVSRRDLPIVVAHREEGATTVAATMWIAHRAGIRVFATGGIGGVHRGHPQDVSADLAELARTPVVVVCSGAKEILDLPHTLEWLETWGVPVVGYQSDELPAFYVRHSGLPVDVRADTPADVARIAVAQRSLGLESGLVVAVPIPEEAALDESGMEANIAQALDEAKAQQIKGKEITPFLLSYLHEHTHGQTLRANIALLLNNAAVAARIAGALPP